MWNSGIMVTYNTRIFAPINVHTHRNRISTTLLQSGGSIKLRFPDCLQLFFALKKRIGPLDNKKNAVQEIPSKMRQRQFYLACTQIFMRDALLTHFSYSNRLA